MSRPVPFLSSFVLATLCLTSTASAQRPRHADTWAFGARCRMSWNAAGSAAVSTLDPTLATSEGSAAFSDPDTGVPLIVTDGNTVWNGIGGMLATGLMGDASSMHAGIIVPVPGAPGRVYVFGHPSTTSSQISYRAFDTTGLGMALGATAAVALPAGAGREGMIAIPHTNGRDFWIVISGGTQVFVVPVTLTGVGAAVAYPTQVSVWNNGWHLFAADPEGRRIVITGNVTGVRSPFESLPFDPTTGVISAGTLFTGAADYRQTYGGAFSPDGTKLYFATLDEIESGGAGPSRSRAVQYDFSTATFTNLHGSATRYTHGDVRRGPDGRMYMAGNSIGANLSVIATPNAAGAAAGYTNASYPLIATCTSLLGIGQALDGLLSLRFRCGDGVVSGSETCDDGNSVDGDGCSAACAVETNTSCTPLLINGGFELGAGGNNLTGAALTGWTITGGTIDHGPSYPRTEGERSIDLTGCAAGTITQTIPTVPGTTYRLLFDYGANALDNLRFAAEAIDSGGATLRSTEFRADASALAGGTRMVSGEISFTATTATTTLRFRTTLNSGCSGNWLDNVRLGPSTCERICGNRRLDTGETCDDGNLAALDGCSSTCAIEPGYVCTGTPSTCTLICVDDSVAGPDTGCAGATPHCIGSGATLMCAACGLASHCADTNPCTTDTCSDTGVCANTPVAAGSPGACAAGTFCSGAPSNTCVACLTAADCVDTNVCTVEACVANVCEVTSVPAGMMGMCAGSQVCSGPMGTTPDSCVQCTSDAQCSGATAFCNTITNTCGPCTADFGGTGAACPEANPLCAFTGPMMGICGRCITNADCEGHSGGPLCDLTSGACGTACNVDADCGDGQWCPDSRVCAPQVPNGMSVPTAGPAGGMCTETIGMRTCLSGVCFEDDDLCGLPIGETCTDLGVCRSAICAPSGLCAECDTNDDCTGGRICVVSTGTCVMPDGGMPDAGPGDAGARDAGPGDGGLEMDAGQRDAGRSPGGLAGGAFGCAASTGSRDGSMLALFGLVGLALARRRKR